MSPDLSLSSPAFADGELLPRKCGFAAENVNPPLHISGVPDEAESLALTMRDPDAKAATGTVWSHWVVWNVSPDRERILEDWDAETADVGRNDFDERGYGGPDPPDDEHTYRFRLYALDTELDVLETATVEGLQRAMQGHVVEEAVLEGRYAPIRD
ncbi:YbhB/YbcL family Raf kinase inhibitor-like protein [Salinirarus marinus]|uniref:YbhB/YbcL family Raf kinase inhibitor-like protein n=1 Tax=Salinirarus marinus TaxID=3068310 RepID=UPI003C6BF519